MAGRHGKMRKQLNALLDGVQTQGSGAWGSRQDQECSFPRTVLLVLRAEPTVKH